MVPGAQARAVGRLRRFASAVTYRLTHTHEGPEILTLCAQKCATLPLPARSRLRKKRSRGFARKTSRALSAPPPGDLGADRSAKSSARTIALDFPAKFFGHDVGWFDQFLQRFSRPATGM